MWLNDFYQQTGQEFNFTRAQASRFAKQIADDFNPLHDIDAKRFCVPGDLLFALTLAKHGLAQTLDFRFLDMVQDGVDLHFSQSGDLISVVNADDKACMSVTCAGDRLLNASLSEQLARAYVAFSGHTFPHILVPLWREHQVMVNPARPMVIYQSMHLQFDRLDIANLQLEAAGSSMTVDGKRGLVTVSFVFKDGDQIVGRGEKSLVLSGLRAFDEADVQGIVDTYDERKLRLG